MLRPVIDRRRLFGRDPRSGHIGDERRARRPALGPLELLTERIYI